MIPEAKLRDFLHAAAIEHHEEAGLIPADFGSEPPNSLTSEQIFVQRLGWSNDEKVYFQGDGEDLLQDLARRGWVQISAAQRVGEGDSGWIVYTFTVTQSGLDEARRDWGR